MLERSKCERDEEVVGVMSNVALKEYVFFLIWIDEEVSEALSFPLADVCMTWADGIKWVGRWCRRCSQASLWIEWQGRRWKGRFVTTLPGDIGLSLNLSVPLVLFPSICLSIPHASVFCAASIIHPEQMNISRGCWTLFLHTSCSHCCLCFYQSARCPSSCSATVTLSWLVPRCFRTIYKHVLLLIPILWCM